jgi:hypothetical protein
MKAFENLPSDYKWTRYKSVSFISHFDWMSSSFQSLKTLNVWGNCFDEQGLKHLIDLQQKSQVGSKVFWCWSSTLFWNMCRCWKLKEYDETKIWPCYHPHRRLSSKPKIPYFLIVSSTIRKQRFAAEKYFSLHDSARVRNRVIVHIVWCGLHCNVSSTWNDLLMRPLWRIENGRVGVFSWVMFIFTL